jgi:F0F1-type ATP synthase membrane subunit b/b'
VICYDVLYNHFAEIEAFLEEKNKRIEQQLKRCDVTRANFRDVKRLMAQENATLRALRDWEVEDYRREHAQLKLELD